MCSCLKIETVEHIIFECENYKAERRNLFRKLRVLRVNLEILRQRHSQRKEFQILFQFLREMKALDRI